MSAPNARRQEKKGKEDETMKPLTLTDEALHNGVVHIHNEYIDSKDLEKILRKLSTRPRRLRQCNHAKRQRLDGVDAILARLPPPVPVNDFRLFDNEGLGDAGMEYLHLLPATIRSINFSLCRLTSAGIKTLCEYMKTNTSITKLVIWGNEFGDEGAEYIAEMLRVNASLRLISIFRSQMSPKGYEYIADALAVNKTLHTLPIYHDRSITEQHIQALFQGLKVNRGIKTLNLDGSLINVSPEAIEQIVLECLRSNFCLTTITGKSFRRIPEIDFLFKLNALNRKIITDENAALNDWFQCVISSAEQEDDVSYSFFFLRNMPELCMHSQPMV